MRRRLPSQPAPVGGLGMCCPDCPSLQRSRRSGQGDMFEGCWHHGTAPQLQSTQNHAVSACIFGATSGSSPAHHLSLQCSHRRLQISQELYIATPWQCTLFFVSFHVHVLFFFLSFICFLSPFDFLLFYSRALAVNVRSLTFVVMHKYPRVLGVRGLGNTMGLLTCERCTVEVLRIFPHLWHGCLQLHGGCSKWPRGSIPLNWVLEENMWMGTHCFKSFVPDLARIHCQGVVMRNRDSMD